jgi:hypothetical protein
VSYSQTVYGWMGRIKEHRNSTWSELAMENWHKSDGKYEVTNYLPECRKFVVRFEAIMAENVRLQPKYDGKLNKGNSARASYVRRSCSFDTTTEDVDSSMDMLFHMFDEGALLTICSKRCSPPGADVPGGWICRHRAQPNSSHIPPPHGHLGAAVAFGRGPAATAGPRFLLLLIAFQGRIERRGF